MAILRIQAFGGKVPVQGDRALPESFATESINTWLYSQELRALHPSKDLQAINTITRKVFRIPLGTVGGDPTYPTMVPPPSYLGDSVWQQFTDPNTDIIRGPLVNDSFKRWYFCSPTTGPMFNTLTRLQSGDPMYKLGAPAPTNSVTATATGGTVALATTRAYVYTYINLYGEESAPSPPQNPLPAGNADGTWTITGIADVSGSLYTGYAPESKKRLYRSVTGQSGATTFYMVADIPLGTTTYTDNSAVLTDATIVNNLQLESTTWSPAPADMQGFALMPNGFMIGWRDSDVFFSVPYRVHAWPAELDVSTEYPIVGQGIFGQTCVLCTQGFPEVISGISPYTTALAKTTMMEPCLNRGSIISTQSGVYYASQNGLINVGPNGVNNITQQLITKEDWGKEYSPQFLRACKYQNGYLALRAFPAPNDNARSAFYLDLTDLRTAVSELSEFDSARNVQTDIWSGEVFTIQSGMVQLHDPAPSGSSIKFLPYLWKSKEFQYVMKTNFGAYALFWDQDRFDNTSTEGTDILAAGVATRMRVWADRTLVYDQTVPANGDPIRLPSGFKALLWQFEVRGRAPVYKLHVASTVKELRAD